MELIPLTADRWRQIETIFHQALAVDHGERSGIVSQLCRGDLDLRAEVEVMLRASDREICSADKPRQEAANDLAGRRVGNFQLERLLGEGGMGSVYLARRADGQFEQQVAIKLLAPYLRGELFTDRFRSERQALANLNHSNVTRILDSGVTAEGDPYLVMEYVDGRPIDLFCDEHRLTVPDRVKLFAQVCTAVEYAHRNRIIHRDLKPSNILVSKEGTVKLLDFGTAKLLETAEADTTQTRFRMMTPRYASPEQLRGEQVAELADVYSLGIVLYELLTGAWPFGDPASVVAGLERAIREVDATPPSHAITPASAEARSTSLARLARTIDGDLANIVLKAIQPDPQGRYRSVAGLASDLESYLAGKPVVARPQTVTYRAQKFLRRNTRAMIAAALTLVAIAVSIGAGVFFGRGTAQTGLPSIAVLPFTNLNSDPADRYFSDGLTDELIDSLSRVKMLRVIARSSTFQFRGKTTDVREAGRLLNVSHVLKGTVERSGDHVRIVAHLDRVADGSVAWSSIYERGRADLLPVQSDIVAGVSDSLRVSNKPTAKHVPGAEAHDFAMKGRYSLQQGTPESLTQAALDFQHAIDLDPRYAEAYYGLGVANWNQVLARGSTFRTEAEARNAALSFRKALELEPTLSGAKAMLAVLAMQFDWDWKAAERDLRDAVSNASSATAESSYAALLTFLGRPSEADSHLRRMMDLDPYSTTMRSNLALIRSQQGRYAEARQIAQQLASENPKMVGPQQLLGGAYIFEGHPEMALPIVHELEGRYPQASVLEAMAYAKSGQRSRALELLRPYEEKYPNPGIPMQWFALTYACLGDEPTTVKWLTRSADLHEWQALNLAINPAFSSMRGSPGFRALRKRMGLDF